jgi:carboxyl-terminal processing protease
VNPRRSRPEIEQTGTIARGNVSWRRTLPVLVAAVAVAGSFLVGFEARSHYSSTPAPAIPPPIGLRAQVLADLRDHYVASLPAAAFRARSVAGVLRALDDPYTRYLSPFEYMELRESEAGSYGGLGLSLARADHGLVVKASLPGLPGRMAGIRAGDVITSINGSSLASLPYRKALRLIAGAPGSRVRLSVSRGGAALPRQLMLVRSAITIPAATTHRVTFRGAHYRYVRLLDFETHTASRVRQLAAQAVKEHDSGLVLDLRGNPGGLLTEAVGVVRVFVSSGAILTTVGRHETRQDFMANHTAVGSLRVAVLIDGETASAAEVVAGALRAHGAVVVGRRTYGKGTVQSVVPLPGGGALKLTVARFMLPGGIVVEGQGVRPTLPMPTGASSLLAVALRALAAH